MGDRNRWWLTLIGVGMVAYAVALVWGQIAGLTYYSHFRIEWQALVPTALIGAVGATALVLELLRQPDDPRPHLLAPAMEAVVSAWRVLWQTKWLLWVYGSLAAVAVLASIVQGVVGHLLMLRLWPGGPPDSAGAHTQPWLQRLLDDVPFWSSNVLDRLVPRVGTAGMELMLAVVLAALLFWVLPRLLRLRQEPEYSGKAGFFTFCLVLLVCANALVTVHGVMETRELWISLGPASSARGTSASPVGGKIVHPDGAFGGRRAQSSRTLVGVIGAAAAAISCAILVGGVVGSLLRSRGGAGITRDTFLADCVRFFEPLAGIYLVSFLLRQLGLLWSVLPSIVMTPLCVAASVFVLPLIYAPFSVVTNGLGFAGAVSHSLRAWRSTLWGTIRWMAVAAFLLVVYRALTIEPRVLLPKVSWLHMPLELILAVTGVAVQALVMLGLWEFYLANVHEEREALGQPA